MAKSKNKSKEKCPQCGKELGKLKIGSAYYFDNKRFCSFKCKDKYGGKNKKKEEVKEIKCKCNQCGKVWHYLEQEEKEIRGQVGWSAFGQMTCCLPLQLYSKQEGGKWKQKLDKFKKCPKCGSHDITKKERYYKKKS